jgi:hypothetical protein
MVECLTRLEILVVDMHWSSGFAVVGWSGKKER